MLHFYHRVIFNTFQAAQMNATQAGTPFPYQLPALRNKETSISDATRGYFGSTRLVPRPNSQETHAVGRSYLGRRALPHIV
jgi:hypothetical protein